MQISTLVEVGTVFLEIIYNFEFARKIFLNFPYRKNNHCSILTLKLYVELYPLHLFIKKEKQP